MSAVEQYMQKRAGILSSVRSGAKKALDTVLPGVQAFREGVQSTVNAGTVGRLAGEVGVLAGAAGLGVAASNAYYAATKANDFSRMLDFSPELKQHHDGNPKLFRQLYGSFRNMNPEFASDPVVSAHFMTNMMNEPTTAGQVIIQSLTGLPKRDPMVRLPGITAITPDPVKNKMLQLQQQKMEMDQDHFGKKHQLDRQSHAQAVQEAAQRAQMEAAKLKLTGDQHAAQAGQFKSRLDFDQQSHADMLDYQAQQRRDQRNNSAAELSLKRRDLSNKVRQVDIQDQSANYRQGEWYNQGFADGRNNP